MTFPKFTLLLSLPHSIKLKCVISAAPNKIAKITFYTGFPICYWLKLRPLVDPVWDILIMTVIILLLIEINLQMSYLLSLHIKLG